MFYLPGNWKLQIWNLFTMLSDNDIYYPEFNLNNIVILDTHISFVDYGLAEIRSNVSDINKSNCAVFIKLLSMLQDKYKDIDSIPHKHVVYNTFINTIRLHNLYPLNVF